MAFPPKKKGSDGLSIMNQAAGVVEKKHAKKQAPAEGSPEEEAAESPAEAVSEGDVPNVDAAKKRKAQLAKVLKAKGI